MADRTEPAVGAGSTGRLSWAGTALFSLSATVAAAWPTPATEVVAIAVDAALFAVGVGALAGAYVRAVLRSRTEEVSVLGVFFLAGGAAPRSVRRALLAPVAAQVVVALATASARPFTPLAFGVLVPTFGLGMVGLWGAAHGRFPPRRRRARRHGRPGRER